MRILGIDPGIAIVGYGIVNKIGNRIEPVAYGKITTPSSIPVSERLYIISQELAVIIKDTHPEAVAIEKLFFNKNTKTAMNVAEARGAIQLTVSMNGLPVSEYTPLQVKQAVCGWGGAEKKQVQSMVRALLSLKEVPKPDDVADALAIAICHAESYLLSQKIKEYLR
ncbi:MAG: crossover junction endodeoxyribonuclease RuvC [Candidatus Margulisiibacteriota bacterium]|nr:MAG: crossover junction endodeoxyribonuclease RuvC [Candidatus Margulisbacteria bacterium GWD2_39_127]OGI03328.1 MAG: crossover junction endodeoxyribonuclease RuvC [Candidatus Margulisbacteria bacterium GWF2_38_17]OGI12012.1 MAG: crossover junction endodeoxyribonuclease RuvC [Candidatus Margulisbacteria bacterium GWE2_39_32]PZM77041.1 MAG: crossover junction endodeoxyribonuclease RuvC [Candidatus Margulisiibacteriota bacterium]HAR63174.1 crossover junction endodeoxyribonuclease RuvC [Candida